ncbi:patatin family protein [Turicibacter sanguinis]|nr:patatin family protein [Turicibacter sanguinis]MTH10464.1 patatin family protein [Turicibacter sanguinis]MTH13044.1 patatin family protein [Turicibacter sanguinis]MTH20166.1 patatin family protein [Turicibacter sanguinis]MTH40599.1 patatin family protein [Turicibacter sanguinis]
MKVGLVLEGGGMRGFYTMGALDYLMEQGILFDYVIGVSAGACHGVSYVSNQAKRSYRVNTNYLGDKRYISFSNFIKTRSIFGMDFIFDEVPHKLDLFDYDTFFKSPCEFKLGVTDVETGKPVYFDKTALDHDCTVLKASSSIPVFSPIVEYKGKKYLDGGTSDAIPVKKALEDGCDKVVVILTRDRHYQKSPEQFRFVYKRVFKKYPKMIELLDNRHKNYNETLAYLRELESEGKALVIAPSHPITISRFEKHKENLEPIYAMGRKDLSREILKIKELLKKA